MHKVRRVIVAAVLDTTLAGSGYYRKGHPDPPNVSRKSKALNAIWLGKTLFGSAALSARYGGVYSEARGQESQNIKNGGA
jgi:hypothetical protein